MPDHTSLLAWQVARDVSIGIHRLPPTPVHSPHHGPLDQARRAALSVQLNIAEGYAWKPGPKWRNHLRIALGSAIEAVDVLHHLLDTGGAPNAKLFPLIKGAKRSKLLVEGR